MATVSHHVYSRYDPDDREGVHQDGGQADSTADPWQTQPSFSAGHRAPPKFVPASAPAEDAPNSRATISRAYSDESGETVSSWYRSLTSGSGVSVVSEPVPERSTSTSAAAAAATLAKVEAPQLPVRVETRDKNNWFISRVLREDSSISRSASNTPPSLADLLSRQPPPLSTEASFKPPVFLSIGPANRGYTMLTNSGWTEGEGLGSAAAPPVAKRRRHESAITRTIKKEDRNTVHGLDDDVVEMKVVDVIDLTSDHDSTSGDGGDDDTATSPQSPPHMPVTSNVLLDRTTLLTPIATVLKSDRLGIGLKAKTEGPHKASRKRVTHNTAALAAHIRASEELRRTKKLFGRGGRGFARVRQREEASRRNMLAYMND